MIVANPPYVAAGDPLPPEVADWEPAVALVAGPTGLEAIDHIVGHAPEWLTSTGVLVCEIGETQAARGERCGSAGRVRRRRGAPGPGRPGSDVDRPMGVSRIRPRIPVEPGSSRGPRGWPDP